MRSPRTTIDGKRIRINLAPWFAAYNIPPAEVEYRFHPERKWRFDFCWPDRKVAFEVEGGKWTRGRHQRPHGFEQDCYKYSWAAILGWCVIRATTDMLKNGEASVLISAALASRSRP